MAKTTVGYWAVRGLAEPIWYLLHYKGVDFEEKRYTAFDQWHKDDKFKLGLDFPNLPYYIDSDVKLSQSITILRYLAEKHGLDGNSKCQKVRVSLAEQQFADIRKGFSQLCHHPDFENKKGEFIDNIPDQIRLVEAFLGDRAYLAGDVPTYVDFMAYDILDMLTYLAPNYLDQFPRVKAHKERIRNLPELQKYFNSEGYRKRPINMKFKNVTK